MIWLFVAGAFVVLFGFSVFFGAPYVPSRRRFVARAFDRLYGVGPSDTVVDIGSGDGRVLRWAAERGARAVGYEINPILVLVSRWLSRGQGNVEVRWANFWRRPLPAETTLVYIFGVSRDSHRLDRLLQREANRLNHPIALLSFGNPLSSRQPEATLEAYSLYRFHPLQPPEAQV